jgi:tRNA nucleotidyltransferase (CCA-adding enzyme)
VANAVQEYVRGLGLDAYLVGGAVRDELLGRPSKDADFLVPGVDIPELRERLRPHGRSEELTVAGRAVGVRFFPRERAVRELAPAGIELAPPRREVSTGPGRHDFAIAVDPEAPVEADLERRDFTINAIARRLADDTIVDPFAGRADLEAGVLRTVSPRSFAEDPLRIVRGLRFVSQLDVEPDAATLAQMQEEADAVRLVSGERIGGGLAADGLGELSKLLLGARPAHALRLARDTGVLVAIVPEFGPAIGYDQRSRYHDLSLDEHLFAAVQAASDAGAPLRVRLAALLHDLGKPPAAWEGPDGRLHFYPHDGRPGHEQLGAEIAGQVLRRLRYPTELRTRVVRIVRHHMLELGKGDALRARRLLARFGEPLLRDLLEHREADLRGKRAADRPPQAELDRLASFRAVVEAERGRPHRLADLAVGGDDLIAAGFPPGPELGQALRALLDDVVGDPALNERDELLRRAVARRGALEP